jgi:hypothetical protein
LRIFASIALAITLAVSNAASAKAEDGLWIWYNVGMLWPEHNPKVDTRSGDARVSISGGAINIVAYELTGIRGHVANFSGRIEKGQVNGVIKGFFADADRPLTGIYRRDVFEKKCVLQEIILWPTVPTGEVFDFFRMDGCEVDIDLPAGRPK